MNVLDAGHRIGIAYPGGIKALAARMDKNAAVFTSQLNPSISTHHLSLSDAVIMQVLADRHDVVIAMAEELGGSFVLNHMLGDRASLTTCAMRTMAEFGDYMRMTEEALQDGRVTSNELKGLEAEFTKMLAEASRMQGMLRERARENSCG